MAAKTFYFKDAVPAGATLHRSLQDGGTAPTTATTTTGWVAAALATGQSCIQNGGSEVARTDGQWGTTLQPSASVSQTVGDCWRSENQLTGSFANTNWTFTFGIRSVTAAWDGRCKLAVRVWRSTNTNGSSPTELTSGRVASAATTAALTTTTDTVVTVTWTPGATKAIANEYLFVQVGFEITTAGTSGNTKDVDFRVGSAYTVVTPDFVTTLGTIAVSDSSDGPTIISTVTTGAVLAAGESSDTTAVSAARWTTSQIAAGESSDTTAMTASGSATRVGRVTWIEIELPAASGIALLATDSSDTCFLTTVPPVGVVIAAGESSDTTAVSGASVISVVLATTDSSDTTAVSGEPLPVTVLNTANGNNFSTDTTPTVEFTGTDVLGHDLTYEVQIAYNNGFTGPVDSFVAANNTNTNIRNGGRVFSGHSFGGNNGILDRATIAVVNNQSTTGNVYAQLWSHSGTYGTSSVGGTLLATSDVVSAATITAGYTTFPFSGANRVMLAVGTKYVIGIFFDGGDASHTLLPLLRSPSFHSGNWCHYSNPGTPSWSFDATIDGLFEVYVYVIDKFSASDAGFLNTVSGGDTDPFTQNNKISYTVQGADALVDATYYWRARAKDPSGLNTFGEWSQSRSFVIGDVTNAAIAVTDSSDTTAATSDSLPITVLNTAAANDFGTDTTPTLEFTGTDSLGHDLTYEVQITPSVAAAAVLDSYDAANKSAGRVVYSGASSIQFTGQSFHGAAGALDSVSFHIGQYGITGLPTGPCYAQLWSHSGTYGTSDAGGTLLATSDSLDTATFYNNAFPASITTLQTFTFSGANRVALASGTDYIIGVYYPGGNSTNAIVVASDSSSPTHSGQVTQQAYPNSGWSNAAEDLIFYLYTTPPDFADVVADSYDTSNFSANRTSYGGAGDLYHGQSFHGVAGRLSTATFYINRSGGTGNVYAQLWTHTGSYGSTSLPGTLLATSDALNASGFSAGQTQRTFTFSGADQYLMAAGTDYVIVLYYPGGDTTHTLLVGYDGTSSTHSGNACYGFIVGTPFFTRLLFDLIFEVTVVDSTVLDKFSSVDAGFLNTVSGGDTDPFTSAQKISFTVQSGDALPTTPATYYWRARAKDPSGTNQFGSWSTARSFSISSVVSATIAATDSSDTTAATAAVITNAAVAVTDSSDTTALVAVATVGAAVAVTDSSDTSAMLAGGLGTVNAPIVTTDSSDTAALTAAVWRTAQLVTADSSDTAAAAATVTTGVVLAAVESSDNTAVTARANLGRIVVTDSSDTAAAALTVTTSAQIAVTDSSDTAAALSANWRTATIAATDSGDTAAAGLQVTTGAAVAATDSSDTTALVAVIWVTAQVAATESSDAAAIAATVSGGVAISAAESSDTTAVVAANWTTAQAVVTDAADATTATTRVTTGAAIVATDASDTAALSSASVGSMSIATTDSADTAALDTQVRTGAAISTTDSFDTTAATSATWRTAQIAAGEASDTAAALAARWTTAGIAVTDSSDTTTIATQAYTGAVVACGESSDVCGVVGQIWASAQVAVSDWSDTVAVVTLGTVPVIIAAIESGDVVVMDVGGLYPLPEIIKLIYRVAAENRALTVAAERRSAAFDPETRSMAIEGEDRTALQIGPEVRSLQIGREDRTLAVPNDTEMAA